MWWHEHFTWEDPHVMYARMEKAPFGHKLLIYSKKTPKMRHLLSTSLKDMSLQIHHFTRSWTYLYTCICLESGSCFVRRGSRNDTKSSLNDGQIGAKLHPWILFCLFNGMVVDFKALTFKNVQGRVYVMVQVKEALIFFLNLKCPSKDLPHYFRTQDWTQLWRIVFCKF